MRWVKEYYWKFQLVVIKHDMVVMHQAQNKSLVIRLKSVYCSLLNDCNAEKVISNQGILSW